MRGKLSELFVKDDPKVLCRGRDQFFGNLAVELQRFAGAVLHISSTNEARKCFQLLPQISADLRQSSSLLKQILFPDGGPFLDRQKSRLLSGSYFLASQA